MITSADDDNSFLNEDLPNLAAQIKAIDDTSFDIPKHAPMKRQASHNSGANQRQSNQNQTNSSQFQPYKLRDFQQMKHQTKNARLGGLGANIGSEEWEKAQSKKEAQR